MTNVGNWLQWPSMPATEPLAPWQGRSLTFALTLLGLFLPWAPAGVSIMLAVLGILAVLIAPALWRAAPWRNPVVATGLVLLAYIALHTMWISGLTPATAHAVNQYHELLMAAILLAMFRLAPKPDLFFRAMVAGAVGYAFVHWLALLVPSLGAYLSSRRISAGLCLTMVAFVLIVLARSNSRPWPLRIVAAFLCVTVLFAIDGRTGHLVLLILAAVVGWIHSTRRWRWVALIALPTTLLAVSFGSSSVRVRVAETIAGSAKTERGDLSSTGIRIELIRGGLALAEKYYASGAGYARYAIVNREMVMERFGAEPIKKKLPWADVENPHSEFVMQLVGGGMAALCLFIVWLVLPAMRRQQNQADMILKGLVLAFAVGCAFNSMLRDFVEGHFYVALTTWLLARPASQGNLAANT
jgi:O-antigen ligase